MDATTNAYWKKILEQCALFDTGRDAMYVDDSVYAEYIARCNKAYNDCKRNEMSSDVVNLDRHKVAAILVIEALKLQVIKRKDGKIADTSDEFFIGPQKILLVCAIHYLAQEINHYLENSGYLDKLQQFIMPRAFSCDTGYVDIMSRQLRNELNADKLYVLSLAEKFFLLEYIAIRSAYGDRAEQVYAILRKPIN